ncbi:MAG: hypothetical protein JSW27_09880 [Phycisphaerales bacterium]|nr:MAG: hypothetical protein JSW27_09880 [Phycisphaerales bacterium]
MCKKSLLEFVAALVLGPVFSALAGWVPALVARWPLDDGQGTVAIDATGNDNDGILHGDPQWVQGVIGGAFEFDGSGDYIDCGNSPTLIIPVNITIMCWIKVNAFTTNWQAIVTSGDGSWRVHRSSNTNYIAWGTSGLDPLDLTGSTDVSTGNGKKPGHQEYTSEGVHELNSGANAKGIFQGVQVSHSSDSISVYAEDVD